MLAGKSYATQTHSVVKMTPPSRQIMIATQGRNYKILQQALQSAIAWRCTPKGCLLLEAGEVGLEMMLQEHARRLVIHQQTISLSIAAALVVLCRNAKIHRFAALSLTVLTLLGEDDCERGRDSSRSRSSGSELYFANNAKPKMLVKIQETLGGTHEGSAKCLSNYCEPDECTFIQSSKNPCTGNFYERCNAAEQCCDDLFNAKDR